MATKSSDNPPDVKEILELGAFLQDSLYAVQDKQIKLTRDVRELKDQVDMSDWEYVKVDVRDTTISDEINEVVSALTVKPPRWRVTTDPDASDPQLKNASAREKYHEGIFDRCGRGQDGVDTRHRLADSCVGDGGAWAKFLPDKDRWEQRFAIKLKDFGGDTDAYNKAADNAARRAGPPFYFGYADPLCVYPTYNGRDISSVTEITARPLYSTLRQHHMTVMDGRIVPGDIGPGMPRDAGLPNEILFYEHWTPTWCRYVMRGSGLEEGATEPFKHGYGRVPYFPAFGFMMGHWANRKVGWGVAETKRYMTQFLGYLFRMQAQVVARDTLTPVIHMLPENAPARAARTAGEREDREEHVGLREVIREPNGGDWKPFPITDNSAALRELIALVQQKITDGRTPRVNPNIGSGMEGAGFAIAQVIAESKIYQHPFVNGLERMYEELSYFSEELLRRKFPKEKVWVFVSDKAKTGYVGLSAKDVDDAVQITVELDPEGPTGKLIDQRYYQAMVEAKFMGPTQAILAQGGNPEEVQEDFDTEALRSDPRVVQFRLNQQAQAMGLGRLMQLARQADQVVATGQPPNGPGPGEPQVPDSGALAATPNQTPPGEPQTTQGPQAGAGGTPVVQTMTSAPASNIQ